MKLKATYNKKYFSLDIYIYIYIYIGKDVNS